MVRASFYLKGLTCITVLVALLSACNNDTPTVTVSTVASSQTATTTTEGETAVPTDIQPSPTPAPLAARVNGMEITLAEYQSELDLYQAATGMDLTPEDNILVLNDLIDQALLAQAAAEEGFVVDEAVLQGRWDQLTARLGSEQALADWMASHGYTEDSFRRALHRSVASAWMRDQIIASVPQNAEQVHARQILLYNSEDANEVIVLLQAGNDFTNLAVEYDPVTGGDLGWFPRGYLLDPKLEEIAFSLQPNEYSSVVETSAGFHILQVIERNPEMPLAPEALLILQTQALQNWLEERRSESDIQILTP